MCVMEFFMSMPCAIQVEYASTSDGPGHAAASDRARTVCTSLAPRAICATYTLPYCIARAPRSFFGVSLPAVAKFATAGKETPKKDLGALAMQYGNVYVAQIALGANEVQTVRALSEAAAWPGPSLVLAYSTCIAHGIDMKNSMTHMRDAVKSGHWPLFRFHPGPAEDTKPFRLDSRKPSMALSEFARVEARFAMLERSDPERAHHLMALAQSDVDERWRYYEQLAGVERSVPHAPGAGVDPEGAAR